MNRPYLYDPALYPWAMILRHNWRTIKEEYDNFCEHIATNGLGTKTIEVQLDDEGKYRFRYDVDPASIIVCDGITNALIDAQYHVTTSINLENSAPVESTASYIVSPLYKNTKVNLTFSRNIFVPFQEKIYDGTWIPITIVRFGDVTKEISSFFPRTLELLRSVPGLESAVYSILEPGTVIHPHKGWSPDILRFHLGLTPYQDAALKVGDSILTWDEGSTFIFDDMETHEVWHRGDRTRISFIVDFRRDPTAIAAYPEFIEERRKQHKLLDLLKGKLK